MSAKRCILCGKCRSVCPVYKVVMKETAAPRVKGMLSREDKANKLFYLCTMCGACKQVCPVDADLKVQSSRAKLVEAGEDSGPNRRMIENLRKYGNPFGEGKVVEGRQDEESDSQ